MTNQRRQPNKWLSLITIPIQMGLVIYLFHFLGVWLDEKYQLSFCEQAFTLLGVVVAMYYVIKQLNQINKNEDKSK